MLFDPSCSCYSILVLTKLNANVFAPAYTHCLHAGDWLQDTMKYLAIKIGFNFKNQAARAFPHRNIPRWPMLFVKSCGSMKDVGHPSESHQWAKHGSFKVVFLGYSIQNLT